MEIIVNLTDTKATKEQMADGVLDLHDKQRHRLVELLTFNEIPTIQERLIRSCKIVDLVRYMDVDMVMVGGPAFLLPYITKELIEAGKIPVYPYSKEVKVESFNDRGDVVKTVYHQNYIGLVIDHTVHLN